MPETSLPSFWEENITALRNINRGLAAELVDGPRGTLLYAVRPSSERLYTCRALEPNALPPAFAHCPVAYDGLADQPPQWIHPRPDDQSKIEYPTDLELLAHDLFIVVRMGLGNGVFQLYQRLSALEFFEEKNRRIIALEDRLDLVRAGFTLYDWRGLLGSTRLLILCGSDLEDLLERFFSQYPYSAVGSALLWLGSGPAEEGRLLVGRVRERLRKSRRTQVQQASRLLDNERRRRSARRRSHVRRVLLIVPGHNYLQRCCVTALREMGIAAHLHLWTSTTYRFVKRFGWLPLLQDHDPDLLILVNATPATFLGGDEIAQIRVLVASWFVDNPRRFVRCSSDLAGVDLVACFDRECIPFLKGLGAEHVIELRTAAGLFRRIDDGIPSSGPRISFVGELGAETLRSGLARLLSSSFPELLSAVRACGEEYAGCPALVLEEVFARHADSERFPYRGGIVELVENHAAYCQRRTILEAIADLGLVTFGDAEWGDPDRAGVLAQCWSGRRVDYFADLPALYAGSEINVNIFHPQCRSGLNPRVYDVLACGGFLLTTYNPGIADEFTDGEHLVTFRDARQLRELVLYYRDRPAERYRIARAGQERVLVGCRYHDRMRRFLGELDPLLTGESYVYPC